MRSKTRLGGVAVLAAAALATSALTSATGAYAQPNGTDPSATANSDGAYAPPDAQSRERAIATADRALVAQSQALHKAPEDSFVHDKTIVGTFGLQYVHYKRSYRGLPVYGGDVIVATDRTGERARDVVSGQQATLNLDITPVVSADAASARSAACCSSGRRSPSSRSSSDWP
ncbi:hypothetical protein ACFQ08_40105, partial [Streptosporangium algeriense]